MSIGCPTRSRRVAKTAAVALSVSVCGTDVLYVGDGYGTQVEVFEFDGSHRETIDLSGLGVQRARPVGFLPPATLVVQTLLLRRIGARALALDLGRSPPSVLAEFDINLHPDRTLPPGMAVYPEMLVARDLLVVGGVGRLENEIREPSGALRYRLLGEPSKLRVPVAIEDADGAALTSPGKARPAVPVAGGRWLVYSIWPNIEDVEAALRKARANAMRGKHVATPTLDALDLFDATGRRLRRWEPAANLTGWIGRPIAADGEQAVYTVVEEPWPSVQRLRIVGLDANAPMQ